MGAHDDATYAGDVHERPPSRPARRHRSWVVGALVAIGVVLVGGTTDAGADGSRPSNYESVIDSVEPDLDQVQVRILGGDAFVEVTAEPGTEVVVPGYDGEPYLRIAPDGVVYRNRRSAAAYMNESRSGTTGRLPARVDASAEPDWERIGAGGSVAWHDHRIHWMLATAPETGTGVVQPWVVPITVDGTEVEISGRLLHHPDELPWAALVGVAVAVLVGWRARTQRTRIVLLTVATTLALVSSLGWYVTNPAGAAPSVLPLVLPALAMLAAGFARFGRPTVRHLVLPLASVALLAGWFVERVGVLWMPTVPAALPAVAERVLTAVVAGIAVGVGAAILLRPHPAGPDDQRDSTGSASGSQSSIPPRS